MDIGRPKKIFIVEDDELQGSVLKDRIIRDIPHHVHIFKTGEDCLKHMDKNPDVIIMDYNLNKEVKDAASGLEILEIVKKSNPDVHVIMMSSQERYSIALQSIQKGAEQYIIKDADAFEKISKMVNEL
ncbi:MAG: response regulator [Bacteroidetes bacterium]|nr:response regulator [Bacteroidota bacterium]